MDSITKVKQLCKGIRRVGIKSTPIVLLILTFLLASFPSAKAWQTSQTVTGTVIGTSDSSPIPGVVVLVKGTSTI